jgi:dTDP-4-amino-4,6-dideoxygalactose transaminase
MEKAFEDTPWRPTPRLKNAASLGATSLMFLVHPTLTVEEMEKTVSVVRQVLLEAQL